MHRPQDFAMITGASSGIGAVYAHKLAERGYPLVLVARSAARLHALAETLARDHGVPIDILVADLTAPDDLARVELRLAHDDRIGLLINNAGAATPGGFVDASADAIDRLIALNVTAPARLARAVVPRFVARGRGAIVNVASVIALLPEAPMGAYAATKAFVLTLSQSLQAEFAAKGLYVQAVLPAATRTEIWERSGRDIAALPGVMEVDALVDAALAGFDRRETITIPPLHDLALWTAYEQARKTLAPHLRNTEAAPRYRTAASTASNA